MKKKEIRIDIATQATIKVLENFEREHPGSCISKEKLFPLITRRAGWLMEDKYELIFDTEAIPPPDEKFLAKYWKDIRLQSARKYKKWIVWDPAIRLGTFEEYKGIPKMFLKVCIGLGDSEEDIAHTILEEDPSAKVFLISSQTKELKPGDEKPGDENHLS
jgi:hypothetical protein